MGDRYSWEDLYYKIDFEGGVDEAIRYGIKSGDVPLELEMLWASAKRELDRFDDCVEEIQKMIGENYSEPEG